MLLRLANTPRDYAWGSTSAISELLGTPATGKPQAELWLGAHPASPAHLDVPGSPALDEWIAENPSRALREGERLPFLMKVLAAAKPLSLQVHPSTEQAVAGFARENDAGLAPDAPERNYRDASHKPELIVALSERFVALSGFRPLRESVADLAAIVATDAGATASSAFVTALTEILDENAETTLAWAVETLLRGGRTAAQIVAEFTAAAGTPQALEVAGATALTLRELGAAYPQDPGVLIGALLNRVELHRGEALYLPAGNVHAYLEGLGIEVMSSSDNVLRGGLTAKHVDIDELLRVADFSALADPRLPGEDVGQGVTRFAPPVDDFMLYRYSSSDAATTAEIPVGVAATALCTAGSVTLRGDTGEMELERGASCFVTGDERFLRLSGAGDVYLSTTRG